MNIIEISLASKSKSSVRIAGSTLRNVFFQLREERVPVVSPVVGDTGYLDKKVEFSGPAAIGVDEHGRRAIYVNVLYRTVFVDGKHLNKNFEQAQFCVFERFPDSDIWVQGTKDNVSFLRAEAGEQEAKELAELLCIGETEVKQRDYTGAIRKVVQYKLR